MVRHSGPPRGRELRTPTSSRQARTYPATFGTSLGSSASCGVISPGSAYSPAARGSHWNSGRLRPPLPRVAVQRSCLPRTTRDGLTRLRKASRPAETVSVKPSLPQLSYRLQAGGSARSPAEEAVVPVVGPVLERRLAARRATRVKPMSAIATRTAMTMSPVWKEFTNTSLSRRSVRLAPEHASPRPGQGYLAVRPSADSLCSAKGRTFGREGRPPDRP
jgi:hypothetical protein